MSSRFVLTMFSERNHTWYELFSEQTLAFPLQDACRYPSVFSRSPSKHKLSDMKQRSWYLAKPGYETDGENPMNVQWKS